MRHERRSRTHARRGGGGFTAGMATANHNHIEARFHRSHIDPIASHLHRAMRPRVSRETERRCQRSLFVNHDF
jgi:hypothetical protein